MAGGIQIDLISREKLSEMSPEERIRFIVDEIKAGKVLVLERGLTAKEELELIRVTMAEIDHESFIGVETPGFSVDLKKQGLFNRLLGRKPPPRMMVVGPAHMLRTIKKDGEMVQAMIVTKESMGQITMDELPPPPDDWEGPKKQGPAEPADGAVPPPPAEGEAGTDLPTEPEEEGSKEGPLGEGSKEDALKPEAAQSNGEAEPVLADEDAEPRAAPAEGPDQQVQEGAPPAQVPEAAPAASVPATAAPTAPASQPAQGERQKPQRYHSLTNYPEEPETAEEKRADEAPGEG